MILGSLVYGLFTVIATVGTYYAIRPFRGPRQATALALATLGFLIGLYWLLDHQVLSLLT
ncbi:MAG: hypothetical protein K8J08_02480 [Thermoanaerobaculia bacterium]|nr:hypothetical protein [Thermoanaerobaculia bacterium]